MPRLGGWLLLGRGLTALTPRSSACVGPPTAGWVPCMAGISYGCFASCTIGLVSRGYRGRPAGQVRSSDVAIYLAYVAGLTSLSACHRRGRGPRARRWPPPTANLAVRQPISGALLGGRPAVGYYGFYELRLIAGVGANPQDGDCRGRPPAAVLLVGG